MAERPVLLLVEDDKGLSKAVIRMFGPIAEVIVADSCKAALEAAVARRSEITAMLIDYSLGAEKTDGIISTFRESFGKEFPIFGWSGEPSMLVRQKAAGCTAVFAKPPTPEEYDVIRAAVVKAT